MIGAAGAAALLLSTGLLCVRRIDTAARICVLQALCAAMALGEAAAAAAVLAFALNGVMLPLVLVRMNGAAMPALRGNALLVWAMAITLLVVIISVVAKIGASGECGRGPVCRATRRVAGGIAFGPMAGARPAVVAERPGTGGRRQSGSVSDGSACGRHAACTRLGSCRMLAAPVSGALPLIVVALPFVSAMVLALVASWRIGAWINAGSASLQFVVAFALARRTGVAEAHLVLLTSLVAMTVSWSGRRDIARLLAARSLNRRRVRFYHVGYQVLIGAIQGAALADDLVLTWLALVVAVAAAAVVTGAVRDAAASAAASRLLLLCGIGLMLALLGTLLLGMAPELASWFLLLGYAGAAGWCRCNVWMTTAAAEGMPPSAVIVTTLLPNVPMLLFMRLSIASGLLIDIWTSCRSWLVPSRCWRGSTGGAAWRSRAWRSSASWYSPSASRPSRSPGCI